MCQVVESLVKWGAVTGAKTELMLDQAPRTLGGGPPVCGSTVTGGQGALKLSEANEFT